MVTRLIHPRKKGQGLELRAYKELIADGWLVEKVKYPGKWAKRVDMYGMFDILALKKIEGITHHRYIQIKANRKPKLRGFRDWKEQYADDRISVEIWVWHDRSRTGFEKFVL